MATYPLAPFEKVNANPEFDQTDRDESGVTGRRDGHFILRAGTSIGGWTTAKIRLDDDYINHPKFTLLSDRAFRVWHEGMCYCRKLMTDGLIKRGDLKVFKYVTPATLRELTTRQGQSSPLWVEDAEGYRVHDYLDWNPSHDEEQQDRDSAKRRMRAFRGRQKKPSVTPNVTPHVPGEGQGRSYVQKRSSAEKLIDPCDDEFLTMRAGALLERYAELFYEHRRGARYYNKMHLDLPKAQELVRIWADDARLEKLAILVLTTDDEWISGTDRGFTIFAKKASWADNRLAEWEAAHPDQGLLHG